MVGRDVRQRLIWQLDISGKNVGKEMLKQGTQAQRELGKVDDVYKRVGRTAVSVGERQRREMQKTKDAAERAALAQARAAVRVEEAEMAASRATERHGQKSTQAKRAVLELAEAERRLAVATRNSSEAAVSAANRQAAASSRLRRLSARTRESATGVGRNLGRSGSAAAGLAGGVASRALGLGAVAGAGFGLAAATRDSVGFEKQMAAVQARLLTTGNNMRRLSDFALDLGAKTQFSAGQAAEAMGELAAAGFGVKQIFKVLPGTLSLAAASGTDLANAAEIQSATLRGFGLAADQANHVADVLAQTANKSAVNIDDLRLSVKYVAPVAKAFNQSMEDVFASVGILGNVGIKGEQAGTSIRRALVQLVKPSKKTVELLDESHISMDRWNKITTTTAGKMRPLPQIFGRLAKATDNLGGREKRKLIAQIFGVEALPAVLTLLGKGEKRINSLSRSLQNSQGAAKRAATIMRNTVAGAWDNFTGSVETSAIKLTRRFLPALRGALNVGAKGVNRATSFLSVSAPQAVGGIAAGLRGQGVTGKRIVGPGGRTEGFEQATKAQQIGQKIGDVARSIGTTAIGAGKQLLDAFRPALPFFQNILLPLLEGIGKGVLISVVGAFKVLVPLIKIISTGLGWIGKVAGPLKPIFQGIGLVIGFLAAGPILKLLSGLGKIGSVFKLMGVPLRMLGGLLTGFGRILGGIGRLAVSAGNLIGRRFVGSVVNVASAFTAVVSRIRGAGSRIFGAVKGIVSGVGRALLSIGKVVTTPYRLAFQEAVRVVRSFGPKLFSAGKWIVGRLVAALRSAGKGVVGALGSAMGFVGNIGRSIADWINSHTPMGDKVSISILGKHVGFKLPTLRQGGLVPILAAGGEMLVDQGRRMMIPGDPRRDSTLLMARPGAAVLTADGQQRMAGGMSLGGALASQAPHFANGGRVRPLVGDAFRQGYNVGTDPSNVASILGDVLGLVGEPHRRKSTALGGGGTMSQVKGPVGDAVRAMLSRARKMAGSGPYVYGGGHGGFNTNLKGYDCSGYVSNILGPGVLGSPMAVRHPLQDALAKGAGKYVTVGIRGTSGQNAHTMARIGTDYYEAGGGHGPARVGGWNGSFDLFHPRGYRAGGTVGGALSRISTGSGKKGAYSQVKTALTSLSSVLAGVTYGALGRIADEIGAALRQLQRGKESKAQLLQIKRLRAALALVEFQAGKRVGALVAQAELGATQIEAIATAAGRRLAVGRNPMLRRGEGLAGAVAGALGRGSAADGAAGLASGGRTLLAQRWQLGVNLDQLQKAFGRAKAHGDSATMRDIQEKITSTKDAIAQNFVDVVENQRQQVLAAAQEAVDASQFGIDSAQGALSGLDISQRLAGSTDTPGAMRDRARAIQEQLLPALGANRNALYGQLNAATQIGDQAGIRSATLAIQQAGNDIGAAMADAADLLKQASMQAAQDLVDSAAHGTSMAQLAETRLELEQRLAGTFETGGAERAAKIRDEIIPALNAEVAALQKQQADAKAAGDLKLADQIGEAVASKQNDVLQAQLDQQEQIAENTDPRKFGGTTGFPFGDETLTDALISVGNGS